MKTKMIILAAMLAAAFSCQKAVLSEGVVTEPAIITTEVETKTVLSGNEVHWTEGDAVLVYDNLGGKNTFTTTGTGKTAEFSGVVTAGTEQIYAVYPAALAGESINGSTLSVTIPAEQTPAEGTFAEDLNITVAKAVKTPGDPQISGVTFKNVCSLLKFTIPAYVGDAQSVTISSSSILAGSMTIDYSGEEPVAAVSSEGNKSISMSGSFNAGSTFCFVVAPNTIEDLTVTVVTNKGTYSKTAKPEGGITLTAGKYKNLGTLDLNNVTIASATAAHTYENNILTGTEVMVSLVLDETAANYVTNISFKLIKQVTEQNEWWDFGNITGDTKDVILREVSFNNATNDIIIPANEDYPYLPSGEYFIEGSYQIGDTQISIDRFSVTVGSPFSSNDVPAFSAKHNVFTSYTKYSAGKIAEANALNGAAIYIELSEANISEAILTKYRKNVNATFLFNDGSSISGEDGFATVHPTTFGAYDLKTVSSSFDGSNLCTSTTEAGIYHITGIPYSYNFEDSSLTNFTNDGWTTNGKVSDNITVKKALLLFQRTYTPAIGFLGVKEKITDEIGWVVSPRFYIPDTNFNVQAEVIRFGYDIASGAATILGYIGAVSSTDTAFTSEEATFTTNTTTTSTDTSGKDNWYNFTLTPSAPYFSISNSLSGNPKMNFSYLIYNVDVKFAE